MNTMNYLFAAYIAIWIILAVYLYSIHSREKKLRNEIERLKLRLGVDRIPQDGGMIMNDLGRNRKLVEAFCNEVFVKHDLNGLERFMRNDYIQHNPDAAQGMKGFREFFEKTFKAMPDFKYRIKQIVAESDLVWICSRVTATHTGGEWLDMPPGGSKLDFDAVDIYRIQDGRIAEHWDVADTYQLFSQLGKIKPNPTIIPR
jgi:CcmD family protein